MPQYYIGLMSGTSLDGIDAVLVDLGGTFPETIAAHHEQIPPPVKKSLEHLLTPRNNEIHLLAKTDRLLAQAFAKAVKALLQKSSVSATHIKAIGSHGQTIRHQPDLGLPYTLQIGDPNTIAAETSITTVADFRRRDIALCGQGAPLAPGFHAHFFASKQKNRIVLNIGGIANITLLPRSNVREIIGFDTGPGNTLLDQWYQLFNKGQYDKNGHWAQTGCVNAELLDLMLADPFFTQPPPKSTGRDYFHLPWVENFLKTMKKSIEPADVQATLLELTAMTIASGIAQSSTRVDEVIVCGGGVHNSLLIESIISHSNCKIKSSETFGIDPDYVEAIGFAWLAQQTLNGNCSNIPSATGARKASILGGIYPA